MPLLPVVIFSDVHGNLEALTAVVAAMPATTTLYCLGDVVGYGPEPAACVREVRAMATIMLAGNHDLAAIGEIETTHWNRPARQAMSWTQAQLTTEDLDMLNRPARIDLPGLTLAHASPADPVHTYIEDRWDAAAAFAATDAPLSAIGHTHRPLLWIKDPCGDITCIVPITGQPYALNPTNRYLLNVGSVGQPRDGDPRAGYVVFDQAAQTITVHRVVYDIAATQQVMTAAGLPAALIARLAEGR